MKVPGIFSLILIGAVLAACNLKEKYARNNLAADQWLQANICSSNLNVTGAWEAEESGWGATRFEQSGSRVNGAMGNYSARGVVRGPRLFLALSSGDYVYYTAVLMKRDELLSGVLFFLGSFQSGRSGGCHAPASWPVGHKHQPGAKQTARRGKRQRRAFSARRSGHPNSWGVAQADN